MEAKEAGWIWPQLFRANDAFCGTNLSLIYI